uniref:Biogenesis of lysosome-related organelles complex 1 subunit 5 n=1 Tax=Bos indicus x Bos taurus TaxID=30522 RepID=A0A4W2FKJ8_BOBOX
MSLNKLWELVMDREATCGKSGGKKKDLLGTTGSPVHLIIKDLGEIHSSLLDHKPVIHGKTHYFLIEFEEKYCNQLLTQSVDSNRGNRREKRKFNILC